MKILITDSLTRKSFDLYNILKIHFSSKDIIVTFDDFQYIRVKLIYTSANLIRLRKGNDFKNDLFLISNKFYNNKIIYIPIEEDTTIDFYNYLKVNKSNNFLFKLPSFKSYQLSRNKKKLNIFCQKNKISCPKYYDFEDIKSYNFDNPLVYKPNHGSGSEGIVYVENHNQLAKIKLDSHNYFFQEKIKNSKDVIAGFYLCENGKILNNYFHKRIRTFPISGGVSVFSKTIQNNNLIKIGSDIISQLNWSGIIMIEYLYDEKNNSYKLIEINPRIWGSILLSEFCGSNFLKSYIKLAVGKRPNISKPKKNIFIRWIFPYDIYFFLKNISNPFVFFKIEKNTCYINFTYTTKIKSLIFIILTYVKLNKFRSLFSFNPNS